MEAKCKNLIGEKFGLWTVISREENGSWGQTRWLCKCDCGVERILDSSSLLRGKSKSCGCRNKRAWLGVRFGRLVVVEEAEPYVLKDGSKQRRFVCVCDCGKQKIVSGTHLASGAIRSCGCYCKERTIENSKTHGMTGTRLHRIWSGMKIRCYDTNHKDYKDYGARGIIICNEWLGENGFQNFYDWSMSNGYSEDLSIDRIDYGGNYEPSNCRWATNIEQANNKSNNHLINYNGETLTMAQLARKYNLNYMRLCKSLKKGVSVSEAVKRATIK